MSNFDRWRPGIASLLLAAALIGLAGGCSVIRHGPEAGPSPRAAPDSPPPPLPVDKAPEDVIVAAWAEPSRLPPAGGEAQILVRLQKRGGVPFPGVQVRLRTSAGSLYSGGKILVTDASGRTRDRLTTHSSAHITLNAGGTVYRFRVPVVAPSS
ncbi:MAG TPA: hypothetical protein VEQ84_06920 [Vicinamibacteria bacterium]|nr:hypothetical protein [Vicinamibacteria bacterium]